MSANNIPTLIQMLLIGVVMDKFLITLSPVGKKHGCGGEGHSNVTPWNSLIINASYP